MIPESYHSINNVCRNCAHCFIKVEYDSAAEFYCTFDQSVRPPCESAAMGENYMETEEYKKLIDELSKMTDEEEKSKFFDEKVLGLSERCSNRWDFWAKEHEVDSNGTCNYFKKKKEKKNART